MALQELAGSNAQNNPNFPGNFIPSMHHVANFGNFQPLGTGNLAGLLQPSPPSVGQYPPRS